MSDAAIQAPVPPQKLPEPIRVDSGELVERVYQDGYVGPDYPTKVGHEQYLKDRAAGKPSLLLPGGWQRVPEAVPAKRHMFLGWSEGSIELNGKATATLTLAATLLVNSLLETSTDNRFIPTPAEVHVGKPNGDHETNIVALGEDLIEEIQGPKDAVQDWLHWDGDKVTYTTKHGTKRHTETWPNTNHKDPITKEEQLRERSGETDPDAAEVRRLAEEIKVTIDNGYELTGVKVYGSSSDELRDPASLGRPDKRNEDYAAERAAKYVAALSHDTAELDVDMPKIDVKSGETVLSGASVQELSDTIQHFGYRDFNDVVARYNRGESLPPALQTLMDKEIGATRGVTTSLTFEDPSGETMTVIVTTPTKTRVKHVEHTSDDGEPNDGTHQYPLIPIIPVPVVRDLQIPKPNFTTVDTVKIKKRWRKNDDIRVENNVWLELYPEALNEDDQLDRNAWAMTRKYQVLMREDRIHGVQGFTYEDAQGKEQILRAMFVDHTPDIQTARAIGLLLQDISQMEGGKVAERLGMIAIFPSENTGKKKPNVIGLGIDEQYDSGILGVAMPAMGLVEVHMPTDPSGEDLEEHLSNVMGVRWTIAHEVAGHFTDVKHRPAQLKKVRGKSNDYVTVNPWENAGVKGYVRSKAKGLNPKRWIVRRKVEDREGVSHETVDTVEDGDARLQEALSVQKLGHPTRYGATSAAESWAEAAAQLTSGILVPGTEFGQTLGSAEGQYATGYSVDPDLRDDFIEHVYTDPATKEKVTFPLDTPEHWVHVIENVKNHQVVSEDPELHAIFEHARTTPLPKKLIRILTQVTNRKS
ncbi:MAG TPA: hypothetical protein PKA02_00350 [Candidatus Saccharibacteria bacterium]|nr:hypothetical protein [Candidatus Saccharibacteria bacterium]